EEGAEPQLRRELDAHRWAAARTVSLEQTRRLDEAPGKPREHQREADLHDDEQDRVVVGARVTRCPDVAAEVEAMRQAPAEKLRPQGQEDQRNTRQSLLMPPCSLHAPSKSVLSPTHAGQTRTARGLTPQGSDPSSSGGLVRRKAGVRPPSGPDPTGAGA